MSLDGAPTTEEIATDPSTSRAEVEIVIDSIYVRKETVTDAEFKHSMLGINVAL